MYYTVEDLIALLQGYPKDAHVYIADTNSVGYNFHTSKVPGFNGPVVFLHMESEPA